MLLTSAIGSLSAHEISFCGGENLCLDGKEIQIRAGELEPQRIPRKYWRHRVRMCKAMGLNAISSYFMWNDFERPGGTFDFTTGNRDVAAFLTICHEEGMWVLFRPGPYICGEWDFGGLPSRLLKDRVAIRTADPRYLAEAEKYLSSIARIAEPFLVKNGGPILLTQIENEYGSWPFKDVRYLTWLKDFWKAHGFGPFYMADGPADKYLKDLIYPDGEIAIGFDPARNEEQWAFGRKYNPGAPVISAETYPGWLRHWGEGGWRPTALDETIKWFMDGRKSFCLFVAHGGTSFGFSAGANEDGEGRFQPDLTSYDYGAPIDEQGRATPAYYRYREIISRSLGEKPMSVPDAMPTMEFAAFVPVRHSGLQNLVGPERVFDDPPSLEDLGQNQGLAIYRTRVPAGDDAELSFRRIADYGQVFLDGRRIATSDRRLKREAIRLPRRDCPGELEVVVEAMGHINYGKGMRDDFKGLLGPVTLGGVPLKGWRVSYGDLSAETVCSAESDAKDGLSGGHFRGAVSIVEVADTFIDMSTWVKGTLYVNGHNLGRYWNVGPQFSLYCPASFLKSGTNVIDIVEMELSEARPIQGLRENLVRRANIRTENKNNVW